LETTLQNLQSMVRDGCQNNLKTCCKLDKSHSLPLNALEELLTYKILKQKEESVNLLKSTATKTAAATATTTTTTTTTTSNEGEGESESSGDSGGHTLESLVRRKSLGQLEIDMDKMNLEKYLSDEDFQKTFNMDKASFAKMPKWKRDREKKKHGLF
jgi:hypothetical protein